jgi:hypothetical protein
MCLKRLAGNSELRRKQGPCEEALPTSGGDGIGNNSTGLGKIIRGNPVRRNNDHGIDLWGSQSASSRKQLVMGKRQEG